MIENQNVQSLMHLNPAPVGVCHRLTEFFFVKILAVFTGAEIFLPQVNCVRTAAYGSFQPTGANISTLFNLGPPFG